ncbi:MAG: peptidylprolyl isomerase [Planctomycetes bacterium]|nr:peptidylprolyl isomerase [Planctomycetota bacterium]
MATRFLTALILGLALVPVATAQTVRFDTNVGNIDLVLNPMGLPELRAHVDNILAYVDAGRYENVVINRADTGSNPNDPEDDFVLQFGGFLTSSQVFSSFSDFPSVESFDPVVVDFDGDGQVDFNTTELTNTRSTVTLALSGPPNTGTNSFFVNVGDSSRLDDQGFVPFARVVDMSTVDYIMNLDQRNLFGDPQSNPTFTDVPLLENDLQVFIERAFVLDPNPAVPLAASSTLSATPSGLGTSSSGGLQVLSIPEPPTLVLLVGALIALAALKGPRRQY